MKSMSHRQPTSNDLLDSQEQAAWSGELGRWMILSSARRKAATIAVDERPVKKVAVDIINLLPDDLKNKSITISTNNQTGFSQNQNLIERNVPNSACRRSRSSAAGYRRQNRATAIRRHRRRWRACSPGTSTSALCFHLCSALRIQGHGCVGCGGCCRCCRPRGFGN